MIREFLSKVSNKIIEKRGAKKTNKKETIEVVKLMEKYKRWAKLGR